MTPVLTLRNVSKTFGGERALDRVNLSIEPGEVLGLLGENGAGKSTLIKILAGYHAPDPGGELEVKGTPVDLPLRPGQFRELGMSFVHQDLALIPSLSVAENLWLGHIALSRRWHISWAEARRRTREVLRKYSIDLDPRADVASISAIDRALLAIVRAVEDLGAATAGHQDRSALLILDEPTAFLPKEGIDKLFTLIRDIAAGGASVLFVSHKLDEVLHITDRITVLRDGQVVGTTATGEVNEAQLIEMIIGRRLQSLTTVPLEQKGADHIVIEGLVGGSLQQVDLHLERGQIVGVTGLLGSGFEDVPYYVFGAKRAAAGRLTLQGRQHELRQMTPNTGRRLGMALVPADRQNDSSIGSLSVADNLSMQVVGQYVSHLRLDRARLVNDSRTVLERFQVRPPEPRMDLQDLSGGNQQKVVLAKWLRTHPALLLLHEPTIGVDVGARQQIYALIKEAARDGTTVLCASGDYEQLADLCEAVAIIGGGRVVRQLTGGDVTEDRIAEQCLATARPASSLMGQETGK